MFQAILGVDIVCQAKSGMGKTAVFVLATLHQLNPQPGEVSMFVCPLPLFFISAVFFSVSDIWMQHTLVFCTAPNTCHETTFRYTKMNIAPLVLRNYGL